MAQNLFNPASFTTQKAKTLPVIFLLDVSGSMDAVFEGSFERTGQYTLSDGQNWEIVRGGTSRIMVLNRAVKNVLENLSKSEVMGWQFLVSAISFGGSVALHMPPTTAANGAGRWQEMAAGGNTPLGAALTLAKERIEGKELAPSGASAYRPVVILVSDGAPDAGWEQPLAGFVGEGRSARCDRMSLGIGSEADERVLEKFSAGTTHPVFHAEDANGIHKFFEYVSVLTKSRTVSRTPNEIPRPPADFPVDARPSVRRSETRPPASVPGTEKGAAEDIDGYW